ncbi:MAG: YhcH/YjgK/YiaL family protein [bacterium]
MAIIFDIDDRQALREQVLYHPIWKTVLDWLSQLHGDATPGEHTVDKDEKVIATIIESPLRAIPYAPFEAHLANIDVHYCLKGHEIINHKPTTRVKQYRQDAGKDVTFHSGHNRHSDILMSPGLIAIFFPEDAHRPLQKTHLPNDSVKKVVVKVPLIALL